MEQTDNQTDNQQQLQQASFVQIELPIKQSTLNKSKKYKRNVDGILLLNKATAITSNSALQEVKHLYKAAKAGHTGILDPLATGVLPICLGQATKFSQFFLDADKGYRVVMQLGITTTTGDAEGEVVSQKQSCVTEDAILQLLPQFRGEISQIPPMYSALKIGGTPLYKLAREGKTVERSARVVNIYNLQLIDFNFEMQQATLDLTCSKGTYVRTLVEDIGNLLGSGAYVTNLCRTQVGAFKLQDTHLIMDLADKTIEHLDKLLLPIDVGFVDLPMVQMSTNAAYYWMRGNAVRTNNAPKFGLVRVFDQQAQFLGIGEINLSGMVAPKRVIKL